MNEDSEPGDRVLGASAASAASAKVNYLCLVRARVLSHKDTLSFVHANETETPGCNTGQAAFFFFQAVACFFPVSQQSLAVIFFPNKENIH